MTDVRRILCLVDFSDTSDHAMEYAIRLAEQLGSELHLLHCYSMPIYPLPDGGIVGTGELANIVRRDSQKAFDALRARFDTSATVVEHLTEGIPHREVQRLSDELGIDMVVMGTHGRTGIRHFLLGSVAERVVRTSPVPVVTVPAPKG